MLESSAVLCTSWLGQGAGICPGGVGSQLGAPSSWSSEIMLKGAWPVCFIIYVTWDNSTEGYRDPLYALKEEGAEKDNY